MTEKTHMILRNLQYDEDYTRSVIPFLKDEYFTREEDRLYFKAVDAYFGKYNRLPTKAALEIEFQSLQIKQETYDALITLATELEKTYKKEDVQWLTDTTETFCREMAMWNALSTAIEITKGNTSNNLQLTTTAIPSLMEDALGVSFKTSIGHDYMKDMDSRLKSYTDKIDKIPFHLSDFNKITQGGAERKTVNCVAGGTGAGKTMFLCDLAANYLKMGYRVLYITNEMAERKIGMRIDANLMNINLEDIPETPLPILKEKGQGIREKYQDNLIIKEYPTSSASVVHFKALMKELKQKLKFVPDIVIVDYLNICASAKFKDKSNSYGYIKSICEELRAFAVEFNICLWTATQLNRDGIDNSDISMKHTSESIGGPMTFDFFFALVVTEDLITLGQVMVKQLKSRYGDVFKNSVFTIGVDRQKMKFFDLANSTPSKLPTRNATQQQPASKPNSLSSPGPSKNTPPKKGNYSGVKT